MRIKDRYHIKSLHVIKTLYDNVQIRIGIIYYRITKISLKYYYITFTICSRYSLEIHWNLHLYLSIVVIYNFIYLYARIK